MKLLCNRIYSYDVYVDKYAKYKKGTMSSSTLYRKILLVFYLKNMIKVGTITIQIK